MVCTHVGKLALALAVLALDILAFVQHMDGEYSTIGLALDCGLLCVLPPFLTCPHPAL